MFLSYILLGLQVLACVVLILLILFQGLKPLKNRLAAAVIAIFTTFSVFNTLSLDIRLDQMLLIRAVMVSTAIGMYILYSLLCSFSESKRRHRTRSILLGVAAIATAILSATPLIFSGHTPGFPPSAQAGPLVSVFIAYFMVIAGFSVLELAKGLRQSSGREQGQYQIILIGTMPILILAPLTGIIFPVVFGVDSLIGVSPLYILFFTGCIAYAIVRHGLFDIKSAAVRSVAYVMSLGTLAALYYGVTYVATIAITGGHTQSTSTSLVSVVMALVLAFIFQPVKLFFDRLTNKMFYRRSYDKSDFYRRFSTVIASTTDLRTLLQRAAEEINATLGADYVQFAIEYEDRRMSAGVGVKSRMPRQDAVILQNFLAANEAPIIPSIGTRIDSGILRVLASYRVGVLFPLLQQRGVAGYLLIGEQKARTYTERDLDTLRTISSELAIAIENAVSIQKIKDLNMGLQQRIDTATAELRRTNDRLKRLDATKDEFLSMASHQLRTPLTSIKGYLSMMIDGDVGKITPMQQKVLKEAYSSSERMVHLIHDFLNVSRLQTGKFMLELRQVDLGGLVNQEVSSLQSAATSHGMTLRFHNEINPTEVMIDETKIRQVVMNYIDNAIYYSKQGAEVIVRLRQDEGDLVLTVKDSGIGVPKAEQARLFGKFFRATNARRQRPDGTGVGLYLAKRVIEEHGGAVLFESRPGRGSTFGFKLPLKKILPK